MKHALDDRLESKTKGRRDSKAVRKLVQVCVFVLVCSRKKRIRKKFFRWKFKFISKQIQRHTK